MSEFATRLLNVSSLDQMLSYRLRPGVSKCLGWLEQMDCMRFVFTTGFTMYFHMLYSFLICKSKCVSIFTQQGQHCASWQERESLNNTNYACFDHDLWSTCTIPVWALWYASSYCFSFNLMWLAPRWHTSALGGCSVWAGHVCILVYVEYWTVVWVIWALMLSDLYFSFILWSDQYMIIRCEGMKKWNSKSVF